MLDKDKYLRFLPSVLTEYLRQRVDRILPFDLYRADIYLELLVVTG